MEAWVAPPSYDLHTPNLAWLLPELCIPVIFLCHNATIASAKAENTRGCIMSFDNIHLIYR
jgi:hypothetical protein